MLLKLLTRVITCAPKLLNLSCTNVAGHAARLLPVLLDLLAETVFVRSTKEKSLLSSKIEIDSAGLFNSPVGVDILGPESINKEK